MNQHLKQAIAAARAGKNPQAKVLLARVIKDEPDNANAWFLLSTLADTDEQKIQHLQKVLELQPNHPTAADQLAELVPPSPEPVEESSPDLMSDTMEYFPEFDEEEAPDIFPLPEVDEPAAEAIDVPDDPDEAMAWLEQLAADQGASLDELPTITGDEEPAATIESLEEDLSWLEAEETGLEEAESLETMPTLIDEKETEAGEEVGEADEEPAKTMTVSEDLDFVSQSEGGSIPAWLVGDEDYISADTVVSETPVEEKAEQPEPETLPDWLNDESLEDWVGEEGEKSGQVVWKAGEEDEEKKPTPPPPAEKKAAEAAAAKQTAASSDNNNFLLALLGIIAAILIFAILYLLIYQPLP